MSKYERTEEAKQIAGPTRSEIYDAIVLAVRAVYDICSEDEVELWHEALFVAEQLQQDANADYEEGFVDGANDANSDMLQGIDQPIPFVPTPHFEVRGREAVLIYPDHTERA
jgi:hypothetical protein